MGLRCLLGHDFGEPELRREREEDGNEVVTTVTEVKTCARCGETQVVSENTEVTTMEQLTDEATVAGDEPIGPDADPEHGASADAVGADGVESGTGSGIAGADTAGLGGDIDSDDAVIIDDGSDAEMAGDGEPGPGAVDAEAAGAEPGKPGAPTADAGAGVDGETEAADDNGGAELIDDGPSIADDEGSAERGLGDDGDGLERDEGEYAAYPEAETAETPADEERAETDDGVILDETEAPEDDRERGAWPDVDESEAGDGEPTPWPEHGGEDEGFSAEVGEGGADDVEFGGGLTPEAADPPADGEDAEYVEAPAPGTEAGGASGAGSAADEGVGITRGDSPDLETSTSEVTTEYYCPECEMTRAADGNSMRAGDICPECKRGYVDERPV
ncbi:DUF7093 family protein [Halorubrum kocurii]|uniref:Uncharacterized protein n=1 Tax=Halorubrum kocurii JCM 14978 TaxID=1230456 RepID=M0P049_9EURY|nr:hypothetical protein [Halorubrum kocurii]EMA63532.1 hypothetical protein C468_09610 [Halorubrum kocurii JCM 14978]